MTTGSGGTGYTTECLDKHATAAGSGGSSNRVHSGQRTQSTWVNTRRQGGHTFTLLAMTPRTIQKPPYDLGRGWQLGAVRLQEYQRLQTLLGHGRTDGRQGQVHFRESALRLSS